MLKKKAPQTSKGTKDTDNKSQDEKARQLKPTKIIYLKSTKKPSVAKKAEKPKEIVKPKKAEKEAEPAKAKVKKVKVAKPKTKKAVKAEVKPEEKIEKKEEKTEKKNEVIEKAKIILTPKEEKPKEKEKAKEHEKPKHAQPKPKTVIKEEPKVELEKETEPEIVTTKIPVPVPVSPQPRSPIVTVMGHVDHGKTTLLDTIRKANVAAKEAGQITQHIGAYEVNVKIGKTEGRITFLDTPGHEAFTAMRARGTQVTDIVVLVVAADDGIMPQTIEAINHAKAAGVPLIVAMNKIDKEIANPEQLKQQLSNYELIPEEWGGTTIFLPVSALKGTGVEHLLEMILLQAEMLELKADPGIPGRGTIIEAKLDKHMGPVATVIVNEGTIRVGDNFIVATFDAENNIVSAIASSGKIRALINDRVQRVQSAGPSEPVEILGLTTVPQVGETIQVLNDKKLMREIEDSMKIRPSNIVAAPKKMTLEDLYVQVKEGDVKELKIVLKGDVQGSIEAINNTLEKISTEGVKLQVIHKGVGEISEADIMLASASNAIVVGFNTPINPNAKKVAQYEEVDIRLYRIIYDLAQDIKKALDGILPPKFEEMLIGKLEVTQTFEVSKVGTIAGCRVIEGKITRDSKARLLRGTEVIHEGKIASLKRFKEDAKEVEKGFECGVMFEKFNDVKIGDIIQAFGMQQIK